MSFAVEGCLSKMHILQENSRKGGRNVDEKGSRNSIDFCVTICYYICVTKRKEGWNVTKDR